ncbi:MAG TPA: hypothetical protein VGR38_01015 [Candidatus Polarisedimenticolia bacterium]|nr:hypothetical protein [Candidatus Polarisedimenticolia bacterium]
MPHKPMKVAVTLLAALLLGPILVGADRMQEEVQKVFVTNFPQTQRIAGSVSVEGLIKHAQMQRLKEIVVPPVGPKETTRLIQAGTLTTDGFTSMVLSLDGQLRGKGLQPGAIGGILVPDEDSVDRVFEEEGRTPFRIELSAPWVTGSSVYFASGSERSMVAFPRYRVFLYNTTDKTVTVNLYAYLTN